MLRITDAQRTKVANVPLELAQHIGIFKDMLDMVPSGGDSEPVVLDEKPETFNHFVLWIFHSPEFVVTRGNLEELLKMAHKYEIPTLARDMCAYLRSQKPIFHPYELYLLGALYGVESLENENRELIVNTFPEFLNVPFGKRFFNTLMRWCPEKVFQLTHDAVVGSECGTYNITFKFQYLGFAEGPYTIQRSSTLKTAMEQFCTKEKLSRAKDMTWTYRGVEIHPDDTPQKLRMQNNAIIVVDH